jgi:hypothetical protein
VGIYEIARGIDGKSLTIRVTIERLSIVPKDIFLSTKSIHARVGCGT